MPVMQIARFLANFADFVLKLVIFVNRVNPLRKVGGYGRGLGENFEKSIRSFKFCFQHVSKHKFSMIISSLLDKQF